MLHLGKAPATYSHKDLLFANYVKDTVLASAPREFGHEKFIAAGNWGMLGNGPDDTVSPGFQGAGDCVFAGAAHETELWTGEASGRPARFTGKEVIAGYSAVTGYSPADPNTDQGTVVRDGLSWRRKTGLTDADGKVHKISAYLALEPGNHLHLYAAMYLFGAVGIGIQFPASAMDQFNAGHKWSIAAGSPLEGGHYIPLVAKRAGLLECVTWGRLQAMTISFYAKYCDEAYVMLSEEHLHGGKTPEGFDLPALQADLAKL